MSGRQRIEISKMKKYLKKEEVYFEDILKSLRRELMRYEIEELTLKATVRNAGMSKPKKSSKVISSDHRLSKDDENSSPSMTSPFQDSEKSIPDQDIASSSRIISEDELDLPPFQTSLLEYPEDLESNQDMACYNEIMYEDVTSSPIFLKSASRYSEGKNSENDMESIIENKHENEIFSPSYQKSPSEPSAEPVSENYLESNTGRMLGNKPFLPEFSNSPSKFSIEYIHDHVIIDEIPNSTETHFSGSLESASNRPNKNISDQARKSRDEGRPESEIFSSSFSKGNTSNLCNENNYQSVDENETSLRNLTKNSSKSSLKLHSDKYISCINEVMDEKGAIFSHFLKSSSKLSDKEMKSSNESVQKTKTPTNILPTELSHDEDIVVRKVDMQENKTSFPRVQNLSTKCSIEHLPDQDIVRNNKRLYDEEKSVQSLLILASNKQEEEILYEDMETENEIPHKNVSSTPHFMKLLPKISCEKTETNIEDMGEIKNFFLLNSPTKHSLEHIPGKDTCMKNTPYKEEILLSSTLQAPSKSSGEHILDQDVKRSDKGCHENKTFSQLLLKTEVNHFGENIESKNKGMHEKKTSLHSFENSLLECSEECLPHEGVIISESNHQNENIFPHNLKSPFKCPEKHFSDKSFVKCNELLEKKTFIIGCPTTASKCSEENVLDKDIKSTNKGWHEDESSLHTSVKSPSKLSIKHLPDQNIVGSVKDMSEKETITFTLISKSQPSKEPIPEKDMENRKQIIHENESSMHNLEKSPMNTSKETIPEKDVVICTEDMHEKEISFPSSLKCSPKQSEVCNPDIDVDSNDGTHKDEIPSHNIANSEAKFSQENLSDIETIRKNKIIHEEEVFFPYSLKSASKYSEKQNPAKETLKKNEHLHEKESNYPCFEKAEANQKHDQDMERTYELSLHKNKSSLTSFENSPSKLLMKRQSHEDSASSNNGMHEKELSSISKCSEEHIPKQGMKRRKKSMHENESLSVPGSSSKSIPTKDTTICNEDRHEKETFGPIILKSELNISKELLPGQNMKRNLKVSNEKDTYAHIPKCPPIVFQDNKPYKGTEIKNESHYEKESSFPNFLKSSSNRSQKHVSNEDIESGSKNASENESFFPAFLKPQSKLLKELTEEDTSSSDEDLNENIASVLSHLKSPPKSSGPLCENIEISNKGLHDEKLFEKVKSHAESQHLDTNVEKHLEPLCLNPSYSGEDADVEFDE